MKYLGPFLVGSAITVGALYAASVTLTPLEDPRPAELKEADALMFAPQPIAGATGKPAAGPATSNVRTVALQNPVPSTMIQPDPMRPEPAAVEASADVAEPMAGDAAPPESVAAVPVETPVADPPPQAEPVAPVAALPSDIPMPKPANRPAAEAPVVAGAETPPVPDVDARFDSTADIWAQKEDPALAALVKAKAAPEAAVPSDGASEGQSAQADDPLAAMIASAGAGLSDGPVDPAASLPGDVPDPAPMPEATPVQVAEAETPAVLPQALAEPAPAADAIVPEPEPFEAGVSDAGVSEAGVTGSEPAAVALAAPAGLPDVSEPAPLADSAPGLVDAAAPSAMEPAASPAPIEEAATTASVSAGTPPPAARAAAPVAADPGPSSSEQMAAVRTPSAGSLKPEPAKPAPALNPGELQLTNVVVLDAGGFRAVDSSQGLIVRIAGVDPLPFNRMCKDPATGKSWPCGAHARAALSKHIGGRPVACRERQATRKGQIREIQAACTVDGDDVAHWLVASGWAEAPSGDRSLAAAAEDARRAGLGQFAAAPSN